MNMLQQYNVRFFKKSIHGTIFYGANTVNSLLDQFISEDQIPEDAFETIRALEDVISGSIIEINYSGQSLITLISNSSMSNIYEDPNFGSDSSHFLLPTSDLKMIMEAWAEFLKH